MYDNNSKIRKLGFRVFFSFTTNHKEGKKMKLKKKWKIIFSLLVAVSIVFVIFKFFGQTENTSPSVSNETKPIHLVFAGDLMMDWSVKKAMKENGVDYPFQYIRSELKDADYRIVNLETSVTERNEKDTSQLFNFKAHEKDLEGVKNAGFDLVSLANNHALDYGQDGLLDTFQALQKHHLDCIGAGKTEKEAFRSKTATLHGKKVKFLAATHFVPNTTWFTFSNTTKAGVAGAYDVNKLSQHIRKEKKDCDYVIPFLHWGIEKTNRPTEEQRTYARTLIDAGADAVIGSHPHWLQGFELYKDAPIAYSIGNFLFPNYISGHATETGLLHINIQNDKLYMKFSPYRIQNNQIVPMKSQKEKEELLQYLQDISYQVNIDKEGNITKKM